MDPFRIIRCRLSVTEIDQKNKNVNRFSAWGTAEIASEKNAIYEVVRDSNIHIISTVRIKEKHELVQEDGKTKVASLGEQEIFMPDFKYEPDLVLRMVRPGSINGTAPVAEVIKTRYAPFVLGETYEFTEPCIERLAAYLEEGADPAVLDEQHRQELIATITDILNSDVSKQTMFPILKEQQGVKDVPLAELPLNKVKALMTVLLS
jgi:hypothetical protein